MEVLLFAIGAGALAYAVVMIFSSKSSGQEHKRTKETLDGLYRDTQQTLEETQRGEGLTLFKRDFSDVAPWARTIYQLPFMNNLYARVLEAGFVKSAELFLFGFFAGSFIAIMALLSFVGLFASIPLGLILGYIVIHVCIKRIVKKRSQAFLDQFPDVLDMIVRSVKSGFPLPTALQLVAENMEDPVKAEFTMAVEEVAMGRSITQAVARMAQRIDEQDIDFFAVILVVQQETGGNLSEVLSNLSDVIRKRKQLRNKVKAITAEGRMTAWIMGLLPVVLFFVINISQPDYMAPFFSSSLGNILLGVAGGLVVMCIVVIRKLADIDI